MSSFRVRYQTIEFDSIDVHLRTLRDKQQFSDNDGIAADLGISSANWSLFGVLWPSGRVLAHEMLDYEIEGKRILEVGCGIGLASLLLNRRQANITATDYHPEAEEFLRQNVQLNTKRAIPFQRSNWNKLESGLGRFDLIIGSDILYEHQHIVQLSTFIDHHAKPHSNVVIVDPGRGNHARFTTQMLGYGFAHEQHKPAHTDYLVKPFKGQILSYVR